MSTLLRLTQGVFPGCLIPASPLSDEAFEELCRANDTIQLERTREGEILMNAPAGGHTGDANREIIHQLSSWWKTHRRGRAFDSNTGFFLTDGSEFSPDAAWVSPERLAQLTRAERARILRLCPDFVIELLSASDRLAEAKIKMQRWIENGARLAWLVDPYRRNVLVYRPGHEPILIEAAVVEADSPVEGFTLDLNEVWSCYEDEG